MPPMTIPGKVGGAGLRAVGAEGVADWIGEKARAVESGVGYGIRALEGGVVGIPDAQWGEIVCAVVVVRPGRHGELDVDILRAHCKDRLAPYKHPRRLEVVDALPRTPATGQIQRALIVERITTSSR